MFMAPRHIPPLPMLLEHLPGSHPRQLAKHLGVSERTVWAYKAAEQAPRPVMLSLFWETPWGQEMLNATAVEGQRLYRNLSESLQVENANLRARIAYLERIGQFDAANEPLRFTR